MPRKRPKSKSGEDEQNISERLNEKVGHLGFKLNFDFQWVFRRYHLMLILAFLFVILRGDVADFISILRAFLG